MRDAVAVEPGAVAVRAVLPVHRDARQDDARVHRRERVVAEPPASSVPGWKFSTTTSASATSRFSSACPAGLRRSQRDRALAASLDRPEERVAADERADRAHEVALPRQLDLDDVGAEVGEQRRRERRADARAEVEDADAGERPALTRRSGGVPRPSRACTGTRSRDSGGHAPWCGIARAIPRGSGCQMSAAAPRRDRFRKRVLLRRPTARDAAAFVALMRASRRLDRPWITAPTTLAAVAAYSAQPTGDTPRPPRVSTGRGRSSASSTDGDRRASFQGAYLGTTRPPRTPAGLERALALVLRHAVRIAAPPRRANISRGRPLDRLRAARRLPSRRHSPRYLRSAAAGGITSLRAPRGRLRAGGAGRRVRGVGRRGTARSPSVRLRARITTVAARSAASQAASEVPRVTPRRRAHARAPGRRRDGRGAAGAPRAPPVRPVTGSRSHASAPRPNRGERGHPPPRGPSRSPGRAQRERGRPSTRSARMLRWISDVPAKIDAAR